MKKHKTAHKTVFHRNKGSGLFFALFPSDLKQWVFLAGKEVHPHRWERLPLSVLHHYNADTWTGPASEFAGPSPK